MIYAVVVVAAIAVAIGFTVTALAGLVVQHLREEAAARLAAAHAEAIALTLPEPVDLVAKWDIEAWEEELS